MQLVEAYCKAQGLFRTDATPEPVYQRHAGARTCSDVVPSIAGPRRPQDRIPLTDAKKSWRTNLGPLLGAGAHVDQRALERLG